MRCVDSRARPQQASPALHDPLAHGEPHPFPCPTFEPSYHMNQRPGTGRSSILKQTSLHLYVSIYVVLHVAVFHIRTVLSLNPDTMKRPLHKKAMDHTVSV